MDVRIDRKALSMELDTGAALSIISEKTWKDTLPDQSLDNSRVNLKTYTGEPLCILGQKSVSVEYGSQKCTLPLVVLAAVGPLCLV